MPRAPAQRGDAVSVTAAADGIKEIGTPLSDGDVESLRAGDRVRITGVLYTARDAAHGRLLPLIEKRSEEHTSELQSRPHLVCRLLLAKKKQMVIMRSCRPVGCYDACWRYAAHQSRRR